MWFCPGNMRDDVSEAVEVSGVGVEDGVLGGVGLPPCPDEDNKEEKQMMNEKSTRKSSAAVCTVPFGLLRLRGPSPPSPLPRCFLLAGELLLVVWSKAPS